jgi:hypothetical protein
MIMIKPNGKYLLATANDTDWTSVLTDWGITFSQLNNTIYDISGLPQTDDISLNNTANFNRIDISTNAPQLSPFRAYWVDISGLIEDYTNFYMTEGGSYKINDIYIDGIFGTTSYSLDICGNQIKAITLAQAVTSIADEALLGLPELTRVNVPKTVTTIGDAVFKSCSKLSTITFESDSSLNSIGSYTFDGASSLTSITIPEGVTNIGTEAFYDCSGLLDVTFTGNMIPPDMSNNTSFPPKSQDITAYYTQDISQNYIDILTGIFQTVVGPL